MEYLKKEKQKKKEYFLGLDPVYMLFRPGGVVQVPRVWTSPTWSEFPWVPYSVPKDIQAWSFF